jgi:hypothetical protein
MMLSLYLMIESGETLLICSAAGIERLKIDRPRASFYRIAGLADPTVPPGVVARIAEMSRIAHLNIVEMADRDKADEDARSMQPGKPR